MKTRLLPIVLIIVFILSLGACSTNTENNNENKTAAAGETVSITTIPGDKGVGVEKTANGSTAASGEKTAPPATTVKETTKGMQKADYNDFIKNSKIDQPTEWTDVGSLVLTDGNYAAPETEVICGEKFLGWTLKSASIKNYGSNAFGIQASFDGEAAVKGTVEYNKDQSGEFMDKIIFRPQKEYDSLFPRTVLDTREGIWFTIDDDAKSMFGISDKPCEFECEIVISEYNIFFAPMGVADRVKIKKVNL